MWPLLRRLNQKKKNKPRWGGWHTKKRSRGPVVSKFVVKTVAPPPKKRFSVVPNDRRTVSFPTFVLQITLAPQLPNSTASYSTRCKTSAAALHHNTRNLWCGRRVWGAVLQGSLYAYAYSNHLCTPCRERCLHGRIAAFFLHLRVCACVSRGRRGPLYCKKLR